MKTATARNRVTIAELKAMSSKMYGDMVKAVVDIEKRIMVVDAEMHVDEEKALLEDGSKQWDVWGINLHPEEGEDDFIEFDSMVNIRPSQGNRSRNVESPEIQAKIRAAVKELVVL